MSLSPRPRFDYRISASPEEAEEKVRAALARTSAPIQGSHFQGQCEIKIAQSARHIWSPHMSVIFEDRSDGVYATGNVGPDLPIWSLFVTLYGAFGIFAMTGLVFGYSQYSLGDEPWGFAFGLVATALVGVLYGIGKVGEGLAKPQTLMMHEFLNDALGLSKPPTDGEV